MSAGIDGAASATPSYPTDKIDSIKFTQLCRVFEQLARIRDSRLPVKQKNAKRRDAIFIKGLHSKHPKGMLGELRDAGQNLFPVFRLYMPQADSERRNYQLKEAKLADCFIDALGIGAKNASSGAYLNEDARKLKNYKSPVHTRGRGRYASVATGDFAGVLEEVLRERKETLGPGGKWTIKELNEWFDQLYQAGGRGRHSRGGGGGAGSESDKSKQHSLFRRLVEDCNDVEITWVTRIILGDLKVSVKQDTILRWYHPDAEEAFASSGDLRSVFLDPLLRDESKRTRFGIKLGQSFYPMNAARYIASEDSTSSGGGDRTGTGSSSGGGGFKWGEWEEFYLEKKLDGERMLVHKLGNAGGGGAGGSRGAGAGSANTNIRVWSRNQTDYTREYGDIMQPYFNRAIAADEAILDGEMMSWDAEVDKWIPFSHNKTVAEAQRVDPASGTHLCFMAFDIVWVKGWRDQTTKRVVTDPRRNGDITGLPLRERKEILRSVVNNVEHYVEVLPPLKTVSFGSIEDRKRYMTGELETAIDNGEEGVMMKQMGSVYHFGQRTDDWLKVKPEYAEGGFSTIDAVIIGGYYGEGTSWRTASATNSSLGVAGGSGSGSAGGARRAGASLPRGGGDGADGHGGDEEREHLSYPIPGHFLVALPEINPKTGAITRWKALCKVGTGYNRSELGKIRSQLGPHWKHVNRDLGIRGLPDWMTGGTSSRDQFWRPSKADIPDLVIDPADSICVAIKGTELVESTSFATRAKGKPVTIRFPRVEKFRFEGDDAKPTTDADPESRLDEVMDQTKGRLVMKTGAWNDGVKARNKKRKMTGSGAAAAKGAASGGGRGGIAGVLAEYSAAGGAGAASSSSAADVEVEVNIFDGVQVCVVPDEVGYRTYKGVPEKYRSGGAVIDLVKRLGGTVVYNLTPTVRYIIAAGDTVRLKAAQAKDMDVYSPAWLVDAYDCGAPPDPIQPEHVIFASNGTRTQLLRVIDEFGDRMNQELDGGGYKGIFDRMHVAAVAGTGAAPSSSSSSSSALPSDAVFAALSMLTPQERRFLTVESNDIDAAMSLDCGSVDGGDVGGRDRVYSLHTLFRDHRPPGVDAPQVNHDTSSSTSANGSGAGVKRSRADGGVNDPTGPACVAYFDQYEVVSSSDLLQPRLIETCPLSVLALRFRRCGGRVSPVLDDRVNMVILDKADRSRLAVIKGLLKAMTASADGDGSDAGGSIKHKAKKAKSSRSLDGDATGSGSCTAVPIISSAWIDACVAAHRVLPMGKYRIH